MNRSPNISKSKFLHGLQCPKLIWSDYNAKHLFPEVDAGLQAVFDQGNEVGLLARKMFPTGIEIIAADPTDFEGAIQLTQKQLSLRQPLFEATVSANGGLARADILNPVGVDEWDLVEVKSTTALKDIHVPDLAFQAWVFKQAGVKIHRGVLCLINNQFVRQGEIEPNEFFTFLDVTAEVAKFYGGIGGQIDDMGNIIRAAKCPDVQIGKQCDSPYTCALHDQCWSFLPARNVFELYGDRKGRRWDLFQKGILRIAEIPADYSLSAKQGIQRTTVTSGKPHVSRHAIQTFLNNLEYPLHFLDFETFSTAIPIYDETSPYLQIPFQFSLHVVHEAGAVPEHRKYLADGQNDPRAEFMRNLKAAIEPVGSILVFNAAFEKSRMKECAEVLPEYKSWAATVNRRVVDLLNPFRAFHFYHPNQNGSASMKSVLPALTGKDYGHLEIQEGNAASREFLRVTFGDVSELERKRVRQALDLYCGRDTEGMIWILDALRRASEVQSAIPK